jgi:hypothetical protein
MGALRDFVADLLESEGAAIEPVEPDGLEVLAPESVRAVLGWPEFARLGFADTVPTKSARDWYGSASTRVRARSWTTTFCAAETCRAQFGVRRKGGG